MMEKKVTAKSKMKIIADPSPASPPQVDLKTFDFPVNSRFISGNVVFTVTRARKDSNTEWRTVISANHGDQDYMLETLKKDAEKDQNFLVVELGNQPPTKTE